MRYFPTSVRTFVLHSPVQKYHWKVDFACKDAIRGSVQHDLLTCIFNAIVWDTFSAVVSCINRVIWYWEVSGCEYNLVVCDGWWRLVSGAGVDRVSSHWVTLYHIIQYDQLGFCDIMQNLGICNSNKLLILIIIDPFSTIQYIQSQRYF